MAALSLEFIVGVDAAPAHALPGSRVFYTSGAYGVIVDLTTALQTHLCGHKGSISSTAVANEGRILFTASADALKVWHAASGLLLGSSDQPHSGGDVVALALLPRLPLGSGGDVYLATLGGSDGAEQSLSIWRVASLSTGGTLVDGDSKTELTLLASMPLPSPSRHHALAVRQHVFAVGGDYPNPDLRDAASPSALVIELATTGRGSVCLCACVLSQSVPNDAGSAAIKSGLLSRARGTHVAATGPSLPPVISASLVGHAIAPSTPVGPVPALTVSAFVPPTPVGDAVCTLVTGCRGGKAVVWVDRSSGDDEGGDSPGGGGSSVWGLAHSSLPPATRALGRLLRLASAEGADATNLTDTSLGPSGATVVVKKESASGDRDAGGDGKRAAPAVTCLLPSPCGAFLLAGFSDGAVRAYSTGAPHRFELAAWWDSPVVRAVVHKRHIGGGAGARGGAATAALLGASGGVGPSSGDGIAALTLLPQQPSSGSTADGHSSAPRVPGVVAVTRSAVAVCLPSHTASTQLMRVPVDNGASGGSHRPGAPSA